MCWAEDSDRSITGKKWPLGIACFPPRKSAGQGCNIRKSILNNGGPRNTTTACWGLTDSVSEFL